MADIFEGWPVPMLTTPGIWFRRAPKWVPAIALDQSEPGTVTSI
jgi:hypothetical protein